MKRIAVVGLLVVLAGCGTPEQTEVPEVPGELVEGSQKFSSDQATLLNFDFDGSLDLPGAVSAAGARSYIDQQMLYTIGHLNTDRSVGRLDKIEISQIAATAIATGTRITFHVKLPVAWGKKSQVPASYAFTLPRAMGWAGLDAFVAKYKATCVDFGAHDVTSGSYWYYYRPRAGGCQFAAEDVVVIPAAVSVSAENTTGKYPEYHQVWADGALNVVAIFGKYEDGATTSGDAGIAAYNAFLRAIGAELSRFTTTTTPASVPANPGVSTPDVTYNAVLPDGRTVNVTALLVDNVRSTTAAFDARYTALSTRADLIIYNGHAGLGSNVRALARKGQWVAGQYLMLLMNGCDTFAYVDGSLAQTRARLNPEDPSGTQYLDIVTNAMPAFFHSMSNASIALIHGLTEKDNPTTYEQMFKRVDSSQVMVVTGEEDNVFFPGYQPKFRQFQSGAVEVDQALAYQTPNLPAGRYTVTLAHDLSQPGGNADLAVKVGSAPTESSFDCRPASADSAERCEVVLTAPAAIFASVTGRSAQSSFFGLTIETALTRPDPWLGLEEEGSATSNAEVRYQTPTLEAGKYLFTLSGTGDADLYVRAGEAPSTTAYDCRPYKNGSDETCTITLSTPASLHVMVRGYSASSTFKLVAKPE